MKSILLYAFFLCTSFIASAQCEQVTLQPEYQGCPGDTITLESGADAGALIQWFFNDEVIINETSATLLVSQEGNYTVEVMQQNVVCAATTDVVFAVAPSIFINPVVDGQVFCQGEAIDITATAGFSQECDTGFEETVIIPDGNGDIYSFYIDVVCFEDDAVLQNVTDLQNVCLTIEHSYLGDLTLELIAPNGSTVILHSNGGGGNKLGEPIDDDANLDPGIGYEYCFTAAGDLLLVDGQTVVVNGGNSIIAGFYLPQENFSQLLGTPLNGTWEIAITDNLASDNGYLFGVDLQFDPDLPVVDGDDTTPNTIVTQAWAADATIIATNDTTITVQPDTAGEFCYDYTVEDDFGCTYTETVCITIAEEVNANVADDLILVDDNADGLAIFDLTVNETIITGGEPDATVNYYETVADSQSGTNPILDASTYISGTRTIYVTVQNVSSGCFGFTSFNIIVEPIVLIDSDNDGVPDVEEDINGNNDVTDDDTDDDGIPNYLDPDDDGDSVPTDVEIEGIGAGLAPWQAFIDTDDDGIENYLDNDDDGDGALTIEEDYNNNGTPLDDDTNNNNLPDFLEAAVNLSVANFNFGNVTMSPNPAVYEVVVKWSPSTLVKTIQLYSVRGEMIQSNSDVHNVSEATISLKGMASGVYFVQLISQDGTVSTQKLIKK